MRILAITSNYPPDHQGGYEIRIHEIINELARRAHDFYVLTSKTIKTKTIININHPYTISRVLWSNRSKTKILANMTKHRLTHGLGLVLIFFKELLTDIHDLKNIDQTIKNYCPDVIYLGNILPLSRTLMPYLADLNIPLVLDDGGATLVIIQEDKGLWYRYIDEFSFFGKIKPFIIKFVGWISSRRLKSHWSWPDNLAVLFKRKVNLEAALEKNVPLKNSFVLHSGIDISQFAFKPRDKLSQPVIIVYPARIEPRKGQLDALKLVAELAENKISSKLYLIGNMRPTFQDEIKDEVNRLKINNLVEFVPMTPHHELVNWYHIADICFFSTYWKDGLSRVPLESMACGCVVITYGNEGSGEIIRDGKNGFLVKEGNIIMAVEKIKELLSNSMLVQTMTQQARQDIETEYALSVYVDRIEKILNDILISN